MTRARKIIPLQGWYVISLRPQGQHASVRRAAAQLGAVAFAVSSLRLVATTAGESLCEALACGRVIVTSPAAVRFANAQHSLRQRKGQAWFAPGAGTAEALRKIGISQVHAPRHGASSEALLLDPALQGRGPGPVGLITAPGGRQLIADELARRGASVTVAHVYRREIRMPTPARRRALEALPARSALLISSREALDALWLALDAGQRASLRDRPCVVSSERLAKRVRELGFESVITASDALPRNLLSALADHVAGGRFR